MIEDLSLSVLFGLYFITAYTYWYWWISLPLYSALLFTEYRTFAKIRKIFDRVQSPLYIWILQLIVPPIPLVLYPYLPQPEYDYGHWIIHDKLMYPFVITMGLHLTLTTAFWCKIIFLYRYAYPKKRDHL